MTSVLFYVSFAGDPYFVEYLEPYTSYELTIRAMSEVGDGYSLKFVIETPDVCKCNQCSTVISFVITFCMDFLICFVQSFKHS